MNKSLRYGVVWIALLLPAMAQAEMSVETTRIRNGVRAWYASNSSVPVVHVQITFEGAGSASDPAGRAGRAAIVAAMLTEGAGTMDSIAFQRALEDKAIDLSIESSEDRLSIHLHTLHENAARAGELLALALSQPRFDEADLARVKTQTRSVLSRLEESPAYNASRKFNEVAFAGHPYATPHYGTNESLEAISVQDLRDYMATYITRGNVLITAAGDVNARLLDTMLAPVVRTLGSNDAEPVPVTRISMQGAGQSLTVPMKVPQSSVMFAAASVPRSDPRFYPLYLLNEILGGNALTSRLAKGIRVDKGLVYGISSGLNERSGTSLLSGSFASRTEQTAGATDAVKAILNEIRQRGVSTQECEDARAHVLGAFPLQLDSSRDVAGILMMMRIYNLGTDYLSERQEKFASVRCGEISALAKEFLAPERFLFVTAGDGAQ